MKPESQEAAKLYSRSGKSQNAHNIPQATRPRKRKTGLPKLPTPRSRETRKLVSRCEARHTQLSRDINAEGSKASLAGWLAGVGGQGPEETVQGQNKVRRHRKHSGKKKPRGCKRQLCTRRKSSQDQPKKCSQWRQRQNLRIEEYSRFNRGPLMGLLGLPACRSNTMRLQWVPVLYTWAAVPFLCVAVGPQRCHEAAVQTIHGAKARIGSESGHLLSVHTQHGRAAQPCMDIPWSCGVHT